MMKDVKPAIREHVSAPTCEQRRETRWPSDEPVMVTVLKSGKKLEGQVVDVSSTGMRVRIRTALPILEPVEVVFRNMVLYGKVRWCEQVNSHFHDIGIAITAEHTF